MASLVEGKSLARNSLLNLVTGGGLFLLSLVFVPIMIRRFGIELYGVLTVTWLVLANLDWLDFGFSRASAKYVAEELAHDDPTLAAKWSWTALLTQTFVGALAAAGLWFAAPWIVKQLLITADKESLVLLTLRIFALAVPVEFAARSLTGVLEAGQQFAWLNALKVAGAIATYIVYIIAITRGSDFTILVYGLFGLRLINAVSVYLAATRVLPDLRRAPRPIPFTSEYWTRARHLFGFGGWVTITAAVLPLILYLNQWFIGAFAGVAALAYFSVPYNLLLRLSIISYSLTATLFPAFAQMNARTEWDRVQRYYVQAHRYLFVLTLPLLFVLYVWTPEILRLWIGADFAREGTLPMRVLIIGFGCAFVAMLSGALLDGIGRPDWMAKFYLAQLPFVIVLAYFLVRRYGVGGGAFAYSIRSFLDLLTLWVMVYKALPVRWTKPSLNVKRGVVTTVAMLAVACIAAYLLRDARVADMFALGGTVLVLAIYTASLPLFVLDKSDHDFLLRFVRRDAR